MLFSVQKVNKCDKFSVHYEWKKACRRYFPSIRIEICVPSAIFRPQGRKTKQKEDRADAIFRPPLTKKKTDYMTLFSIHPERLKI